ncbi:MAG: HD domain-containing protein [Desulfobacterales bacterium]|nr:HD domain-containing protein [Desulfobacterales bacterium]
MITLTRFVKRQYDYNGPVRSLRMKIKPTFLRSTVARRIVFLFICCALIPITALAILSFYRVTAQLEEQSQKRLHLAAKATGLAVLERLRFMELEMKHAALAFAENSSVSPSNLSGVLAEHIRTLFKAMALTGADGRTVALYGQIEGPPQPLTHAERQHISSGKTLLYSLPNPEGLRHIMMCRALSTQNPSKALLLAEIDPFYLWGIKEEGLLPTTTEFCVLDHSKNVLYNSLPGQHAFSEKHIQQMLSTHAGQFEWNDEEVAYIARFWTLFFKYDFLSPGWTVVMSESKTDVLAPMADFKKTFPLVVFLSLLVVLLLSLIQIRKSLIPLKKLQEGTRRIANRDFQARVTITSGDEFEDLATSFNAMADRLGKQFNAMMVMNEIDRSILSALNTMKIVETVLTRMKDLFPSDYIGLALLEEQRPDRGLMYISGNDPAHKNRSFPIELAPPDLEELQNHPDHFLWDGKRENPKYLAPFVELGMKLLLILPIILGKKPSGLVVLGYRLPVSFSEEDRISARQLGDQVAVALSNARLLEQLQELNWGTLYALARAIDAKSPWTAGHSERVTKLALKIGEVLNLSQSELEDIHRAGLLHDIGKIGISPVILDKPGLLNEKESDLMRQHTIMGARILEPITAYSGITAIVLQHHECFDGTGYPNRLAGEDITLGARIFSVADQYDAITSERPYRTAMPLDQAAKLIRQGAGTRYDPKIVRAFLQIISREGMGPKEGHQGKEQLKGKGR